MKLALKLTVGLMVLWALALQSGSAHAQTTANGPYYATPSWDQKLQCDTLATCPRFIVLSNWSNAAVLDRETGTVWEQSPSAATSTWAQAHNHCVLSLVGNRRGWRLPTVQELASLTENPGPVPAFLPAGHPFGNIQTADLTHLYWSATTVLSDSSRAWTQSFANVGSGSHLFFSTKSDSNHAWCVRGGQGLDAQ